MVTNHKKNRLKETVSMQMGHTSSFYLFASSGGKPSESPATVFYKVEGKSLAKSLCELFSREYTDENDRPTFHFKAAASISMEEQVLLDEALEWLYVYDDPDPGVYDPAPSEQTILLAQFMLRAQRWEELLKQRMEHGHGNAGGVEIKENETQDIRRATNSSGSNCTQDGNGSVDRHSPTADELQRMAVEDQRNSTLILLMLLAQAYYKMLECTVSMASWVSALDLELNHHYLWVVNNITSLLKGEDFKDFPIKFEPLFPDLYPSSIRDVDWEDMVGPDVERFLSAVQQYVQSRNTYEPEKGSPGWVFLELFRPSVNAAIEKAIAYNKTMRDYCRRKFGSSYQKVPATAVGGNREHPRPGSEQETDETGRTTRATPDVESGPARRQEKRFKIALSFPGEHRAFVEQVALHLADHVGHSRVLYDKYYEAEFARVDLDVYLQRLYHNESELIVVFLCSGYERSDWCGLEWRAVRDLLKGRRGADIMPCRFDDTHIPGLFSIDGYIAIENRPADSVASLILERLALNDLQRPSASPSEVG